MVWWWMDSLENQYLFINLDYIIKILIYFLFEIFDSNSIKQAEIIACTQQN